MPETRITNELTYSTQFIESIINLSPDIIYIYDLIEHKNIYSNDGVQRVLGYSTKEVQDMGSNLLPILMHPDDFEIYLTDTFPQYARLKEKQPIIHEYRMKHKNGTWRWLDCNEIIYLRQQDGTPIQIFGVVHDITQQKELQDKLLIVNKAVESISVAIGISDAKGHHFYQNKALSDLFEYATASELEAAGGGAIVVNDPEVAKEMFGNIMSGKSWSGELEMVTKSGRVFPAYEYADAILDDKRNIVGLIGIITDIIQRKQVEKALRDSETRYRALVEWMPEAIAIHRGGNFIYVNPAAIEMLGAKSAQDLIGTPILDRVHPDYHQIVLDRIKDTTDPGIVMPMIEEKFLKLDGTAINAEVKNISIIYDGEPAYYVAVHDITERKKAEHEITLLNQKNELILNSMGECVYGLDSEGIMTFVNPMASKMLGRPINELIGQSGHADHHHTHADGMPYSQKDCKIYAAFRTGLVNHVDSEVFWRADGSSFPVEYTSTPIKDENGQLVGAVVVFTDITERKMAELEYKTILQTAMDGFLITDLQGQILDVNDSYCSMIGYDRGELLNMGIKDLDETESVDIILQQIEKIVKLGWDRFERRHRCKDGRIIDIEISTNYMDVGDGKFIVFIRDITQRKRAEEEIQKNRALLTSVIEGTSDAIFIKDLQGRYLLFNSAAEKFTGKSAAETIGKDDTFLLPPAEAFVLMEGERKVMEGGKVLTHEEVVTFGTGEILTFLSTKGPVFDASGKLYGLFGVARNITERKLMIETLQKSEKSLHEAQRLAHIGSWQWTVATDTVTWSEELYKINGFDPNFPAPSFATMSACYTPQSWDRLSAAVAETLQSGEPYELDLDLVRPDGTVIHTYAHGEVDSDALGKIVGLHGTVQDITERKIVENKLRESEQRNRHAQQISGLGYWEWNIVTGELYWSELVYSQHGLDSKTFHPSFDVVSEMIHPDDRERTSKAVQATLNEDAEYNIVVRVVRPDGNVRYIHTIAEVIRDAQGNPIRFVGTQRDITERKQAGEALQQSEEKFRSIFDNALDGILVGDIETKKNLFGNKMICKMLGFDEEEIKNTSAWDLHPEKDVPYVLEQFEKQATHKIELVMDIPMKRKDGSVFYADINSVPITFGGNIYMLGIFRDSTERKHVEDELRNLSIALKNSNEELTHFAYIASHDLQEPLRMISSYLQLIERRYKGQLDTDADEFIHFAVDGANRLQEMITGLLYYSRVETQGKPFQSVDFLEILENVRSNLKIAIDESGAIITNDPLPTVLADKNQFIQVLQNLISNSIKFKGENPPQIQICAKQISEKEESKLPDAWLFSIKDNGIGIDPQHKDRLFNIFQRLHGNEIRGIGIGLSVCKRIVERHGGHIWFESEVGNGSTFYFTIPIKEVA